ncbi:MAG: hypothetical protein KIT08_08835 [Anaerolineales bacterium]|nr:MAG: hypothetical protein KIT08_08835 [Anaerolineales bacterium]
MKRGPWHQLGNQGQTIAREHLQNGIGVGVVISEKDLPFNSAKEYSTTFKELNADVLVDHQFYNSSFRHKNFDTYPEKEFRVTLSNMANLSRIGLSGLSKALEENLRQLSVTGVIAPAMKYQAGRNEIVDVNAKLFSAAKAVGDSMGLPTFVTVTVDRSSLDSFSAVERILSDVTSLSGDGWYFSIEFGERRIPASSEKVKMLCRAGLKLAMTGKPVMHAFAGPMSLLSYGFGATAAAIGHSHNLWQFSNERWQILSAPRKGPKKPLRRLFSSNLWGTLVYPNEIVRMNAKLRAEALTSTEYSPSLENLDAVWKKGQADRHLVASICREIETISRLGGVSEAAKYAINKLAHAESLYGRIKNTVGTLRDSSNAYHSNWKEALENLLIEGKDDLDYLEMIASD